MSTDKPNKPEAQLLPEPVVEREGEITKSTSVIERRLVTILSADVAGYSKLMAEHEEHTLKVFRQHKKVFEQLIELHGGRIFNTAGDAILAEFPSAVEGVRCATEIQSALRTKNDKLPEGKKVLFRIGVNLGDVIVQGTDLLGDGVNLAARVQTSAEPGGVCISGAIWDQVQNKLSLNVSSLGEVSYKNIPNPVRTFSVVVEKGGFVSAGQAVQTSRARFQGTAFLVASACMFVVAAGVLYFLAKGSLTRSTGTTVVVNYDSLSKQMDATQTAAPAAAPAAALPAEKSGLPPPGAAPVAAGVKFFPVPKPVFQRPWAQGASKAAAKWVVAAEQTSGNARPTIAEAVAAAAAGDVIEIRPGTYRENFVVDKDITLRGLPGDDGNVAVAVEWQGLEVAQLSSGKVTVENMNFLVEGRDPLKPTAALLLNGASVNLFNVGGFASGASGSSGLSVRGGEAFVKDSEFRGARGVEHYGGKLECEGCVAPDAAEEGYVVMNQGGDPAFRSVFRNCVARNAGTIGIAVMTQTSASFEGCEVTGSTVNGVQLHGTAKVKFTGGEVKANKELGFLLNEQSFAEVRKTRVIQNGTSGFAALGTAVIDVRDSEITGNGEYGIALLEQAQAKDNGNRNVGNRSGGSYRMPASTVPAK